MKKYFYLVVLLFLGCRQTETSYQEDTSNSVETDSVSKVINQPDTIVPGLPVDSNRILLPDESKSSIESIKPGNLAESMIPAADSVKAKISIKVYKNTESSGYGYDIIMDGRLYIHQPNIPALPGNAGFSNKEDAQSVAELVVTKIRNNIMPPTIDVKELENMGIK